MTSTKPCVASVLRLEIGCERVLHSRERREFRNLVFSFCSFDAAIDFLQPDKIGTFAVNHIGDSLEVQFLIHPRRRGCCKSSRGVFSLRKREKQKQQVERQAGLSAEKYDSSVFQLDVEFLLA